MVAKSSAVSSFVVVLMLAASSPAFADSITITSETDAVHGANSITRDSAQGLDFLDVDLSIGRSIDDVSGEFGVGGDFEGFRYATADELVTLINNWGFSPGAIVGMNTPGTTGGDQLSGLVDMLETTYDDANQAVTIGYTGTLTAPPHPNQRLLQLSDVFSGDDAVYWNSYPTSNINSLFGSFLVRDSPASNPVPEPGTLALLGLGMAGLGWHRRRRMKAS